MFDDEDDMLDKKHIEAIYSWFDKNVKFVKQYGSSDVSASDVLSVNSDWKGADVNEKILTELYSKTNHIIIDIRKSKLSGKFLRQINKYGLDVFYEKNKKLFDTLFTNGIEHLSLGMYRDIEIYEDHIEFAK